MRLKSNIGKIYASMFLSGFVLWYAIEKLFMQSIGIDAFGIALISVIYIATVVLLDIPTGVLADKWSRKYTLILATALQGASSYILGISAGFWMYAAGAVLYGLYEVGVSGTYEAVLYDSLHETKQTKAYSRVWGRAYGLFLVGVMVASPLAGVVADLISLQATYFLTLIPAVLNILILVTLKEPVFHKEIEDRKFIEHAKYAGSFIIHHRLVFDLALLYMVANILQSFTDEFGQLYFIALGLAPFALGLLNGIWAGSAALGQFSAHKFARYENLLLPVIVVLFIGFSLINTWLGVCMFLIAIYVRNVFENRLETKIQNNIESSVRATTISILGFAANIITIPMMLVFGWVARQDGIFLAFQTLVAALSIFYLYRVIATKRWSGLHT